MDRWYALIFHRWFQGIELAVQPFGMFRCKHRIDHPQLFHHKSMLDRRLFSFSAARMLPWLRRMLPERWTSGPTKSPTEASFLRCALPGNHYLACHLKALAMVQQCNSCIDDYKDSPGAKLKLCSGCRKVYYCSTACQTTNWVFHIFDCKPRDKIKTVYYLARAVYDNLLPEHPQTCEDYGFNRAVTDEEKSKLLGL